MLPARAAATPSIDPRFACFRIAVRESAIHRLGVYAEEPIPPRRKVIEYTGARLNRRQTKVRLEREIDLNYLFTLDHYWTLDGSVGGSGAEYINHCCDPNLETRVLKGHILYMSKRGIAAGEELSVDYHFPNNVPKVPCRCGSPKCRGTINVLK